MSFRKKVAKADIGKHVETIRFVLTCSNKLQDNKGNMNVDAIISHGKALYDATQVLGWFFSLTDKGFLVPFMGIPMYFRLIYIDICDGYNMNGFTNLRRAVSQNLSLDPNKFISLPHFHDDNERVRHINFDPEAKKLFIS